MEKDRKNSTEKSALQRILDKKNEMMRERAKLNTIYYNESTITNELRPRIAN